MPDQERSDEPRLSQDLERWLGSDRLTIGTMSDAFGEQILAVACLLLVGPSALPLPTGGATHVLLIIAFLFAAQLAIGRDELWIPKRWEQKELGGGSVKVMSRFLRIVRWFERFSRPRLGRVVDSRTGRAVVGLLMCVFIAGAFFSPPFSGLDTLPSLGVLLLALGVVLRDALFCIIGIAVGGGGIGLSLLVGAKIADFIGGLF